MEELDRINIQTTSSEGQSIQTVVNNGPINLTTQVSDVPQIQTVMQENVSTISSIINNPFVEVTSVNGQTGDVITEPVMEDFRTNHYYLKNTIVNYNENIYWSKTTFTSGNSFNISDWNKVDITYNTNWNDITNKPSFSSVATSGNYNDLNNLPTIGNATLTIQTNGVNVDTFTANATNNKTINISVPVSTSQLTNDSGFINTVDSTLNTTSSNPIQNKIITQTINDINARIDDKISYGNIQSTDIVANAIITTKIANNAITTAKITDNAVTTIKIANGAVTAAKTNLTTFKNNSNVADNFGWTYIGQTIITSPNADIKFTSPTKYDNYKVVICAALSAGSSTWADVRMLDGATNLYNYHQVQQASGTNFSAGINSNVIYCANGTSLNQYDGIDAEVNIYGAGTNWVKFHGIFCAGQNNGFSTRIFNGRNTSATKPDTFELITGGTFNTGSWIKVWGSNN